jgi:ectoine hydroxylase-related dioxygenase (phytanoyl-CoA dioxygenase family)
MKGARMTTMDIQHTLEAHGFAVVDGVVAESELGVLIDEAERLFAENGRRGAGVRNALPRSEVFRVLAGSPAVRELLTTVLGPNAIVVRSILFDKTPDANWDVTWHQDTTIAVRERIETPGFGPWSMKVGVPHVRPPAHVLEQMLTLRLHLDRCGEDNGPLLVVPGSHHGGMQSDALWIEALHAEPVACVTGPGSAVLMRPLLFHASRKAHAPSHRRVLHLEFASGPLPPPLRWALA